MTSNEEPPHRCQLYLITPAKIDLSKFADVFASALDAGPIACVQLRLKGCSDDDILAASETLMPIAHDRDVAFLINDRPDLAKAIGADGVHIGQNDESYDAARGIVGPDAIVGVTCHNSRHLAMEAGDAGADYVAFGAFFPTETKETTHRASIDDLAWWSEYMTVPSVAIGGITPQNCTALMPARPDFLAVCNAIWNNEHSAASGVADFAKVLE